MIGYRLLPQIEAADIYKQRLEGAFLEWHLPSEGVHQWHIPNVHMKELYLLADRGSDLSPSLEALTMTRMGRLTQSKDLVTQGLNKYGHALRRLHVRLLNDELAVSDETLAIAQILSIFEVRKANYTHKFIC